MSFTRDVETACLALVHVNSSMPHSSATRCRNAWILDFKIKLENPLFYNFSFFILFHSIVMVGYATRTLRYKSITSLLLHNKLGATHRGRGTF
jgi:hypothetical protein